MGEHKHDWERTTRERAGRKARRPTRRTTEELAEQGRRARAHLSILSQRELANIVDNQLPMLKESADGLSYNRTYDARLLLPFVEAFKPAPEDATPNLLESGPLKIYTLPGLNLEDIGCS